MCLILFAWKTHPDYPLVVAANRDEFYERPSQEIHWWGDHQHVLGGKDLAEVEGQAGTWMGISKTGRFAALTNVRSPSEKLPNYRSRGEITREALISSAPLKEHLQSQTKRYPRYNGFNLLAADLNPSHSQLYWLSNRTLMGNTIRERKLIRPYALAPGIYGLSNAMLDTPWPKVKHRIAAFMQTLAMDSGNFSKSRDYFKLLAHNEHAADHELPKTGVSYEWEKALSPAFIATPNYGTRASTLLRVRYNGALEMIEHQFNHEGKINETRIEGELEDYSKTSTN